MAEICELAITDLTRSAERAGRAGSPARTAYVEAADLVGAADPTDSRTATLLLAGASAGEFTAG